VVTGQNGGAEVIMSKKLPTPGSSEPNGQGGQGGSAKTPQQEA